MNFNHPVSIMHYKNQNDKVHSSFFLYSTDHIFQRHADKQSVMSSLFPRSSRSQWADTNTNWSDPLKK